MAIDNQFGKGIGLAAGFDLGAQKPLDSRVAVNTIAERDAHVTENRAYEGMLVYVAATKMTYQLVNNEDVLEWKEFGFNQDDFNGSFEGAIQDVDDRLKAVEEDLAQGGETETRIAQAESDIDGLQGLVGQPAQAGEGEEEGTPATGLHLALDTAKEELEQDILDEKGRAEGVEAAIRGEMATEAQRVDKKIADDIAAESALRVAEEQRIEGKVDAEAQRADAEEKRIVGLVEAEAEAARAAELKLTQDLAKEVEDRGKAVQDLSDKHDQEMEAAASKVAEDLAALKTELQGEIDTDVAAEAKLREDADKALDERVKPLEEFVAAQPDVDAVQDDRIKALEDDAPVKQAAIEAAQAAADAAQADVDAVEKRLDDEGGLVDRIEANEANIARLDGAVDVEGSVKKQIKDAIDEVNGAAEALEARVKANEDDIVEMKAEEAKIREDFAAADDQVLADAKKHADDAITALVDSAPDAMNTLNELAKAINDNKGIYDAYVTEHNQAMAALKEELQGEIDADVKVVADELAKQKDAAQEGTLAKQIADEVARATGQEAAIRQELANEKAALQAEIDADVKVVQDELNKQKDAEQEGTLANQIKVENERAVAKEGELAQAIADEKGRAEGKEGELLAAINKEVQDRGTAVAGEKERAEAQEAAIRQEMADAIGQHAVEADPENGVEAVVASGLRKEMDDAVAAEKSRAMAEEADIRADFAAADESLHATVKSEMAAVIQSLAVGIVDGKLRVALGGIEGDDVLVIREHEIDFVTDAEIEEIIAGLDAVEGE